MECARDLVRFVLYLKNSIVLGVEVSGANVANSLLNWHKSSVWSTVFCEVLDRKNAARSPEEGEGSFPSNFKALIDDCSTDIDVRRNKRGDLCVKLGCWIVRCGC